MKLLILKKILASSVLLLFMGQTANAAVLGGSSSTPGYSAKDILFQGASVGDGMYWIDPDLPGGNSPIQAYADMTSFGGGWTLSNDAVGGLGLPGYATTILATDQDAQIRLVGSGLDAYYTGRYGSPLAAAGAWSIGTGDPSSFYGAAWGSINLSTYDIYVREIANVSYPATVPLPAAAWLFGSALLVMVGAKRRKA